MALPRSVSFEVTNDRFRDGEFPKDAIAKTLPEIGILQTGKSFNKETYMVTIPLDENEDSHSAACAFGRLLRQLQID